MINMKVLPKKQKINNLESINYLMWLFHNFAIILFFKIYTAINIIDIEKNFWIVSHECVFSLD